MKKSFLFYSFTQIKSDRLVWELFSRSLGHAVAIFLIVVGLFSIAEGVSAQTYIERDPLILTDGRVGGSQFCTGTAPTGYGFRLYSGSYPDTSTLLEDDVSNIICTDGGNFGYFPTIEASWGNLNTGFATLSGIGTDGNYWIAIATQGSAFTPNWSGVVWVFNATRFLGDWFAPAVLFPTTGGIINIYPETATTTTTTTVVLGADILNNGSTLLRVSLTNYDTGQQLVPFDIPITLSGLTSIGTTTVLSGGFYSATYQLIGGSVTASTSVFSNFTVLGSNYTVPYSSVLGSIASTTATCSDTGTSSSFMQPLINFGCFLFVPSPQSIDNFSQLPTILESKIPFSYYYQARDIILSGASSTASTSIGTVTLDIGFGTTTYFSLAQTKTFFDPWINWDSLKSLTTAVLWVGWLYFVYRRVTALLPSTNKS